MDTVYCQCEQCGNRLAEFANDWLLIGSSSYAPRYDSYDTINLTQEGEVRDGIAQTLYEGWFVSAAVEPHWHDCILKIP